MPRKPKQKTPEKEDPRLITSTVVVPYRGDISFEESENPYKKIRQSLGVSIPTLCEHMKYNRGTYGAVEYGSPTDPPPVVLAYFRDVHHIPEIVQRSAYFNFQKYTRSLNVRIFGDIEEFFTENAIDYDSEDFIPLKSLHPFIRLRRNSNLFPMDVASRLCVPITSLSAWESTLKTKTVPTSLVQALLETGYTRAEVQVLSVEYEKYYAVTKGSNVRII